MYPQPYKVKKIPDRIVLPHGSPMKLNDRFTVIMKRRNARQQPKFRVAGLHHDSIKEVSIERSRHERMEDVHSVRASSSRVPIQSRLGQHDRFPPPPPVAAQSWPHDRYSRQQYNAYDSRQRYYNNHHYQNYYQPSQQWSYNSNSTHGWNQNWNQSWHGQYAPYGQGAGPQRYRPRGRYRPRNRVWTRPDHRNITKEKLDEDLDNYWNKHRSGDSRSGNR